MYQIILEGDGSVLVSEVSEKASRIRANNMISKTVYTAEENMPDDLCTKLSMLKLLTPPDGYEHVGNRIDDVTFWIY